MFYIYAVTLFARMPDRTAVSRRRFLIASGGVATISAAGCIGDDDDPGDDDDGMDDGDDGDGDDGEDPELSNADRAQQAWETIVDNPAPEDEDLRNEAHVEIEAAVRDDMILLPLLHGLTERFWYEHVDVPHTGALGAHHQQHNHTEVEGDSELSLINATFFTLDPAHSADTASAVVINQMYETLTHYEHGVPELENKLLEEFEVSDDGLTWQFTVKEGVQFHDGGELTADDVAYSWERLALSDNSTRANFILGGGGFLGLEHETDPPEDEDDEDYEGVGPQYALPDSLGIEVLDDRTVEIQIREPQPGVLDILTYTGFAVIPEGLVGDIPGYDGDVEYSEFNEEYANGTGPFTLDYFEIDQDARVVRFDDYHGDVASLEAVHWEIIEDSEAAFTYAMEMNADIFGVPTAHYDPELIDAETDDRGREVGTYGPLENDETANYLAISELSTYYFGFNARHVPQPVRQAVAYATDHAELVEEVFAGRGVEAFTFTPPPLWPGGRDAYDSFVEEWPYSRNETDIAGAEEVLAEAGHTEDDPFQVTLTTYESPVFEQAAELTRDKLAGTGVEFDLEEAPFGTLIERGYDGDLEMFSLGWIWSWEDLSYGHYGFEPKNTDTSRMPEETSGYMIDWQAELDEYA